MVCSSVANYLQAVTLAHKLRGLTPPSVSSFGVKLTLAGIKRVGIQSTRSRDPVTLHILLKMYNCLNLNLKSHTMFWAMCLLLFRSLLRVSHVVKSPHTLVLSDLIWGQRGVIIRVKSSKCSNIPHDIPVAALRDNRLCLFYWLNRWLSYRGSLESSYLFADNLAAPVSYHCFSKMLSLTLHRAGVKEVITSHSFRHGGASFLASLGVPLSKIKERGGWKSDAVFCYLSEPLDSKIRTDFLVAERLSSQLRF